MPLIALIGAMSVAEGVLRVLDHEPAEAPFITDPIRGWALRPGFRGRVVLENDVRIEINSDGLRDREHQRPKPSSTVRIALLGDSYMEAETLPFEQTITPQLEHRLETCVASHGRHAEVMNFACPATVPARSC